MRTSLWLFLLMLFGFSVAMMLGTSVHAASIDAKGSDNSLCLPPVKESADSNLYYYLEPERLGYTLQESFKPICQCRFSELRRACPRGYEPVDLQGRSEAAYGYCSQLQRQKQLPECYVIYQCCLQGPPAPETFGD